MPSDPFVTQLDTTINQRQGATGKQMTEQDMYGLGLGQLSAQYQAANDAARLGLQKEQLALGAAETAQGQSQQASEFATSEAQQLAITNENLAQQQKQFDSSQAQQQSEFTASQAQQASQFEKQLAFTQQQFAATLPLQQQVVKNQTAATNAGVGLTNAQTGQTQANTQATQTATHMAPVNSAIGGIGAIGSIGLAAVGIMKMFPNIFGTETAKTINETLQYGSSSLSNSLESQLGMTPSISGVETTMGAGGIDTLAQGFGTTAPTSIAGGIESALGGEGGIDSLSQSLGSVDFLSGSMGGLGDLAGGLF